MRFCHRSKNAIMLTFIAHSIFPTLKAVSLKMAFSTSVMVMVLLSYSEYHSIIELLFRMENQYL